MKKTEQTRQRYAGNERSLEPLSLKPSIASHSQKRTTKNVPLSSIFNIVLNELQTQVEDWCTLLHTTSQITKEVTT